MKFIFLNVWHGKVKEPLLDFIKLHQESTDVFCFQECYEEISQEFESLLINYLKVSDYKHVTDDENFPQTTFINNRIKLIKSESLLKDDQEIGLGLYTELEFKNKTIHLCNVHGFSKPGDKKDNPSRIRQSKLLLEYFKDLHGMKIIGGDFNLDQGTESAEMFNKAGYLDLIKNYQIETTRNRLVWDRYKDHKQYFSDYVFVNDFVKMKSFEVPENEISDHLAMILEI